MIGPDDLQEAIEAMIDDTSITDVLQALRAVCAKRAEKLLESGRACSATIRSWSDVATAIERAEHAIDI